MHHFTNVCLKRPVSTVIIIVAFFIFGMASIAKMNMQLVPDMQLPMIIVYTIYPQAGPEEVDRLVSQKLENVGATIEGLDGIIAQSNENFSYMIYQFDYGTDINKAYDDLQKEINTVKNDLPEKCSDPVLIIMDINAVQSMTLSVTSDSGADVKSFVEGDLNSEISSIANVAKTSVDGGQEDYIRVRVSPEKLAEYGLSTTDLATYIGSADFSIPTGTVDMGSQTLNANVEVGYDTVYDLESIPILTNKGQTIRLADVADVSFGQKAVDSLSRYDRNDSVTLDITKQQGSNAVQLSKDVKAKVEELREDYPDMQIEVIYDSSVTIIASIKSVGETLILGVILSMAVLLIFFGDIKASLIVGSSMPVSLLVTVLLMYACGFSINIITMGALVIGIGMMVDNSIVVLEMCFQKKDQGLGFHASALDAVKTVATSVTASTITTVVVYLPLALLKGLSGQIFGQLGFTIIFSLTASLISSVTLVPLCFAKYHPIEKKNFFVSRAVRRIAEWYGKVMSKLLNMKIIVILATVAIIAVTVYLATFIHTELMPATDEATVRISVNVKPGLSLENKNKVLMDLEDFVSNDPNVDHFSIRASEASSSLSVTAYLSEDRTMKTAEVAEKWNKDLMDFPNANILCETTSSMSMGMSTDKTIVLRATRMDLLKEASNVVKEAVKDVEGVIHVSSDFDSSESKATIKIDPLKATAAGVIPAQAGSVLYTAKTGVDVMDMSINDKDYTVTIEYPDGMYDNINALMNMTIKSNFGRNVTLGDIAYVEYTDSPETVYRQDKYYQASISIKLDSEHQYTAADEIDEIMDNLMLPAGVKPGIDTATDMMNEEFLAIGTAILIAMWLVFMVMTMQFESARYAALIMFCIPFSLIGSVLFLVLTKSTLSMPSMMGFLMLEGIVVNNGILMVDTTNQNLETMPVDQALVEAGKSRLRPILMTTLTTILSMVPLTLGLGNNGQMMQGMAVVIVGGLVASTLLTLILLPTFYMIIRRRKAKAVID